MTQNETDLETVEEGIALVGNCLDRNVDKMYDLLTKLVLETNFDDTEKLRTLIIGVSFKTAVERKNVHSMFPHISRMLRDW